VSFPLFIHITIWFLLIHFINCQVSKTFREEKILLEEYVFILMAKVGLNAFVHAVGIGSGKHDLTGISMEASNFNQVVPVVIASCCLPASAFYCSASEETSLFGSSYSGELWFRFSRVEG
jgi:hypothetical protein